MLHFTTLSTFEWNDVLLKSIEKILSWLKHFIFRILKLEVPVISAHHIYLHQGDETTDPTGTLTW